MGIIKIIEHKTNNTRMQMQLSNIKNIVAEMDTSSPRKSEVITPRNKVSSLFLDLPMETASTEHASTGYLSAASSPRLSYNSAQPSIDAMSKTERDAALKNFFTSNDAVEETDNYQGKYINVQNFLKDQRIENELRVEENKEFQKRNDTSMVYDREVTIGGRVADKKARNSIRMMGDAAAQCQ